MILAAFFFAYGPPGFVITAMVVWYLVRAASSRTGAAKKQTLTPSEVEALRQLQAKKTDPYEQWLAKQPHDK